jgi:hypothetical protein
MLKKSPQTKWKKLLNYINSQPVGTIITRKEILLNLEEKNKVYNAIDAYKGILLRLNVLKWHEIGKYEIICHIKSNISKNEAKEVAYSNNWRQWFNNIKEI